MWITAKLNEVFLPKTFEYNIAWLTSIKTTTHCILPDVGSTTSGNILFPQQSLISSKTRVVKFVVEDRPFFR